MMRPRSCQIFVNFILLSFTIAKATLLYRLTALGTTIRTGQSYHRICDAIPDLTQEQMRVCENEPTALLSVIWGTHQGFSECKRQFVWERWNCSTNVGHIKRTLRKKTRETAFIYAVTSAGVVHSVTRACSAGNLTQCDCEHNDQPTLQRRFRRSIGLPQRHRDPTVNFQSFGCSDNIKYGLAFGRRFVDAPEILPPLKKKLIRSWDRARRRKLRKRYILKGINRHNNEVGRLVIYNNMKKVCRCYGVSGTCSMKTCFRVMPKFVQVGNILKHRYRLAFHVDRRTRRQLREMRPVTSKDSLLYLHKSPDYCKRNGKKGVLGTKGRECKKNVKDWRSCKNLCCGRGHTTYESIIAKKCKCKFKWCCEVECKTCHFRIERHFCK